MTSDFLTESENTAVSRMRNASGHNYRNNCGLGYKRTLTSCCCFSSGYKTHRQTEQSITSNECRIAIHLHTGHQIYRVSVMGLHAVYTGHSIRAGITRANSDLQCQCQCQCEVYSAPITKRTWVHYIVRGIQS